MELKTGWPQLVWYFMTVMGIVLMCFKHGQYRKPSLLAAIIGMAIALWIYQAGGFFEHIFWPHYVLLGIYAAALAVEMTGREKRINMFISIPMLCVIIYMLYLGKFLTH